MKGRISVFAGYFAMLAVSMMLAQSSAISIQTLSSKPGMVSGGETLVQITGSEVLSRKDLSIWVNERNITGSFHVSPLTHTLIGLVDGLNAGTNHLEVRAGRKLEGQLEMVNHAAAGPIFSGPHQTPFLCQTELMGLGPALDSECNAKTEVTYLYKPSRPLVAKDIAAEREFYRLPPGFKRLDPAAPLPSDVADVTTSIIFPQGVCDYTRPDIGHAQLQGTWRTY